MVLPKKYTNSAYVLEYGYVSEKVITHNLGTFNIDVEVYINNAKLKEGFEFTPINENMICLFLNLNQNDFDNVVTVSIKNITQEGFVRGN